MESNGELRELEADLTAMGRGMTYPAIPNPAPAVVARFEAEQSRRQTLLPALAVSKRWLVGVAAASLLVAVLIVVYVAYGGDKAPAGVAKGVETPLIKMSIGPRWEPMASLPVNLANTTMARLSSWREAERMYITIIGLTLIAIGSLGALTSLIWLAAIRSGYEFPRRYGSLNVRRALMVMTAATVLAVLGFVLSDTRRIPDLFPVFLAGASLATIAVALGLSLVARVRDGGSAIWAVTKGAVMVLIIGALIWLGIPMGDGEPGAERDFMSSLIFFGFALPLTATVGGLVWLGAALIRRRGRGTTAAFLWSAASLVLIGAIGIGIWMRVGEAPTIEGLELLAATLGERPDAPMAGVYVHGSYAFVGGQSTGYYAPGKQGIRILDIADPASPQLVGRIPLRTQGAFGADHSHGDAIVTHIESGAFQGEVALVLEGVPDTFTPEGYTRPYGVWDVTDPSNPHFLTVLNLGNSAVDVGDDKPSDSKAMAGHYFYALYRQGPEHKGEDDLEEYFRNIDDHLAIVDLSDPRDPLVVGDWHDSDPGEQLIGLSVNKAGTRAYVVGVDVIPENGGHGHSKSIIYVLDVQDSTAPVELGRYVYLYQKSLPHAVPNEDDSLVVFADGSGPCGQKAGLRLLDVSEPGSIREVSVFELAGSDRCYIWETSDVGEATDMVVKGNLVYSTWMAGGLRVIDISDPADPVEVGKFVLSPGSPWLSDVALFGDVVLATEIWNSGLYLLR